MKQEWTREDLVLAVDCCLALVKNRRVEAQAVDDAVHALAEQTDHSLEEAKRILQTATWTVGRRGIRLCEGLQPLCMADRTTVTMLEDILLRDRKIDVKRNRAIWSREELKAVIACYLDMLKAQKAGRPVDMGEHIFGLAADLGRTGKAVRHKLGLVSWVMSRHRKPVLEGLAREACDVKNGEQTVLELYAELTGKAPKGATPQTWSAEQLACALAVYKELAELDSSGSDFLVDDSICRLAGMAGCTFMSARLRLANIDWLFSKKGRRPLSCLAACGDMPEEIRASLERLIDAAEPMPARPRLRALSRIARGPCRARSPQEGRRRSGPGSMPRLRRRKGQTPA